MIASLTKNFLFLLNWLFYLSKVNIFIFLSFIFLTNIGYSKTIIQGCTLWYDHKAFFKVTSTFGIKKYSVKVDGKWKSVCKAKRRDSMPNSFGSNCETPLEFKAGDNSVSCIYI